MPTVQDRETVLTAAQREGTVADTATDLLGASYDEPLKIELNCV
jgi:hypothetical protein